MVDQCVLWLFSDKISIPLPEEKPRIICCVYVECIWFQPSTMVWALQSFENSDELTGEGIGKGDGEGWDPGECCESWHHQNLV